MYYENGLQTDVLVGKKVETVRNVGGTEACLILKEIGGLCTPGEPSCEMLDHDEAESATTGAGVA